MTHTPDPENEGEPQEPDPKNSLSLPGYAVVGFVVGFLLVYVLVPLLRAYLT
jgi:hypothetical protein